MNTVLSPMNRRFFDLRNVLRHILRVWPRDCYQEVSHLEQSAVIAAWRLSDPIEAAKVQRLVRRIEEMRQSGHLV